MVNSDRAEVGVDSVRDSQSSELLPESCYHVLREERYTELSSSLEKNQYIVLDNFLGGKFSKALRAEMIAHKADFEPHKYEFSGNILPKPGISEMDLSDKTQLSKFGPDDSVTLLHETVSKLIAENIRTLCPWLHISTDKAPSIKLQFNNGGCFPWHYDAAGVGARRRLTCVYYLNPDWREGDGGEIVLMPFGRAHKKIAPAMDRCVIFLSEYVNHRVLLAKPHIDVERRRMAISMWFDAESGKLVDKEQEISMADACKMADDDVMMNRIMWSKQLQQSLSRAIYSDLYLESMDESVAGSREARAHLQNMNAAHHAHVQKVMGLPQGRELIEVCQEFTAEQRDDAEEDL